MQVAALTVNGIGISFVSFDAGPDPTRARSCFSCVECSTLLRHYQIVSVLANTEC